MMAPIPRGRNVISEDKYYALKQKLEALNFLQPLGIESAPLVEKLLSDLVLTTESYRNLERAANKQGQSLNLLQGQLQPLKSENNRLVRENNKLHQELIRKAEEFEKRERAWEASANRSKSEAKDAKFLRSTDADRIQRQEKEIIELRTRMQQLLERNLVATSTSLAKNRKERQDAYEWQRRSQEIDMSATLPPSPSSREPARRPGAEAGDPGITTRITEREIQLAERLKAQSSEAQLLRDELNGTKASAAAAKFARDKEIARLSKLLEAGRPLDEAGAKLAHDANLKLIDQLQDQIDFLNEQLVKKAGVAEAATAKLHNLPKLESMLRRASASAKTAEGTVAALQARAREYEKTIRSQEAALANLASAKAHRETVGEGAMAQLKQMKGYATTAEMDAAALRSRLESVVREREEARGRVAGLEARLAPGGPAAAPGQGPAGDVRAQAMMVQTLQRERDALRKEIDTVTLRLRQERATAPEALQSADTARANEASAARRIEGLREEMKEMTSQLAEKTVTIRKLGETVRKSSSMASLPQVVSDMREELARMRERCTNAEMERDRARHSETRGDESNQRLSLQIERLEDALVDAQEAREQARRAMVAADNNAEEANARARTAEADRDEALRSYRKISADLQAQIEADNERLLQLDALTDDVKAARETALLARQQSERAHE